MLAKGSKDYYTQDGEVMTLPKTVRIKSGNNLWKKYARYKFFNKEISSVERTSVLEIVAALSVSREEVKSYDDYHLGMLVTKNVRNV